MIINSNTILHSNRPSPGFLADLIMSDQSDDDIANEEPQGASIKDQWQGGGYKGYIASELSALEQEHIGERPGDDASLPLYFKPSEFNLYVNKETMKCYIFHGRDLPVMIERFEMKESDSRITVYSKEGQEFDLGMKIGWLMRPYFKQANKLFIVQTRDGEPLEGHEIPLTFKV